MSQDHESMVHSIRVSKSCILHVTSMMTMDEAQASTCRRMEISLVCAIVVHDGITHAKASSRRWCTLKQAYKQIATDLETSSWDVPVYCRSLHQACVGYVVLKVLYTSM